MHSQHISSHYPLAHAQTKSRHFVKQGELLLLGLGEVALAHLKRHGTNTDRSVECWPLHDIVITNIVWCMTYKREGSYTAQSSSNSIAPGWAMQVGARNDWMVESCTKASK